MKSQDLLILEKLKVGDSSAYKELFDLYYMPLSVYSLKYCDSFELAEDIVQDLFSQPLKRSYHTEFQILNNIFYCFYLPDSVYLV